MTPRGFTLSPMDRMALAKEVAEAVLSRLHPSIVLPVSPAPANDHSPSPTPSPAA